MALVCFALYFFVGVNYNLVDYLPPNEQSTRAIAIMGEEFTQKIPNANVMIRDVSIFGALDYKRLLSEIDGVTDVVWLDDFADLKVPIGMQDASLVEMYYKDGAALFMLSIESGMETRACAAIRELIYTEGNIGGYGDGGADGGEGLGADGGGLEARVPSRGTPISDVPGQPEDGIKGALSGESADRDFMQRAALSEVLNAMAIILPISILILLISTNSWLEPLLFLGAIGVAVLINMGTNIFFGRVSFLTNSVSPLLQLAVSLDYAIFLLHRFTDNLKESGAKPEEAMKQAIIASITAISASALTTLFGFIALVFMEFKIGADLGLILAKGIISSFISVVVFLPALTLCVHKALERTRHRPLLPDFGNVYKIISKTAAPAVVIVLIIIVPGFLGQQRTSFVYGAGSASSGTYLERDKNAIEGIFGKNNIAALLVPAGDIVKERDMCLELEDLDNVNSVMSYARTVGTAIPSGFLGDDITSQFYSDKYARIIIYTDTPGEGDIAFDAVERIQATAGKYYDEYYLAGQSSSLNDMKNIVVTDNLRVNSIAIVTIFLVIMMSFRSLVLPCILLVTIETGIWVNLSIPYFTNTPINFIGFLVISTVQLGATVDYAILLTDHYRVNRKLMDKKAALQKSLGSAVKSILISGFTLSLAGFTLYLTSTNTSIRDIGFLLGRGTLLSMLMVLCFLPPVLSAFDTLIAKGTWGAGFYFDERNGHNNEAG